MRRVAVLSFRCGRHALVAAALAACAGGAHATLITFAEIPWSPTGLDNGFADQPIRPDFYAAQGLLIEEGYLATQWEYQPETQYLLGGFGMQITFTGVLPKYVSLTFNSPLDWAGAFTVATGPGYSAAVDTGGYLGGPPPEIPDPPPRRDVYASFSSPGGISMLSFGNAASFRVSAYVDNLYFGAVPPVPEPASALLMGQGLAGMWAWRRRQAGARAGQRPRVSKGAGDVENRQAGSSCDRGEGLRPAPVRSSPLDRSPP